jgi:hypothetical protein
MRIYRVQFERFTTLDNEPGWIPNDRQRDVAVHGGAEQAIKVALQRERHEYGQERIRVESVTLIARED